MKIPENAALRQAQRDVTRLQERTSSSFNVLAKRTKPPSTRPRLRSEEHERAMRQIVTSLGPAQLQQVVPLLLPLLSPAQSVRLSKACAGAGEFHEAACARSVVQRPQRA